MDQQFAAKLRDHTVDGDRIHWQGNDYSYKVIRWDIEGLPCFAGYPDGEMLFVSETVPPQYRRYILKHEIIEFQDKTTCAEAARQEAELFEQDFSNPNDRLHYWMFRVQFFRDLIAFEEKTNPDGGRIDGLFRPSLAFFEGKQRRDWPT